MLCCIFVYAQEGITFKVEHLSKPKRLLPLQSHEEVYKWLIASDLNLEPYRIKKEKIDIPFHIIVKSEAPDSLVTYGYQSFFNGMYQAYADHRPFVMSPDMIWLLISQGFARHINANPETMRPYFVDFSGKQSLIVKSDKQLEDPDLSWEKIFPGFTCQIKKHVGDSLVDLLTCDFSTTTSLEKLASEITIMEAMKPYFEFIVMYCVCGIPQITLEGTPQDWEKVLNKARGLKKYNLDWWITELEPLLEEFAEASRGNINKVFWRNMFKYHSEKEYGAPNIIDGWIVKFFPYDKDGKRNNLKQLKGNKSLPDEIVKVDLKYLEAGDKTVKEIPLELWAGFIGLTQNKDNFALRPQIGWMIRKKDVENKGLKNTFLRERQANGWISGISIRVKEFPFVLLELKMIERLEIQFTDEIDIPEELAKVEIEKLYISGKIDDKGIERIKGLFPHTSIVINNEQIE